jgi:hypothetical protein
MHSSSYRNSSQIARLDIIIMLRLINVITAIGKSKEFLRNATLVCCVKVVIQTLSVCLCIFEWLGDFSCFFHVKVASYTHTR